MFTEIDSNLFDFSDANVKSHGLDISIFFLNRELLEMTYHRKQTKKNRGTVRESRTGSSG